LASRSGVIVKGEEEGGRGEFKEGAPADRGAQLKSLSVKIAEAGLAAKDVFGDFGILAFVDDYHITFCHCALLLLVILADFVSVSLG
jgi:hypothetical protein